MVDSKAGQSSLLTHKDDISVHDLSKLARGPSVAIRKQAWANSPSLTAPNRSKKRLRNRRNSQTTPSGITTPNNPNLTDAGALRAKATTKPSQTIQLNPTTGCFCNNIVRGPLWAVPCG